MPEDLKLFILNGTRYSNMRCRKKSMLLIVLLSFTGTTWYTFLTIEQPHELSDSQAGLGELTLDGANDAPRAQPVQAELMEKSIRQSATRRMDTERDSQAAKSPPSPSIASDDPDRSLQLVNVSERQTYVPGILTHLPHPGIDRRYIQPRLKLSAGRSNATLVFGIPTIRRPIGIYVLDTLQSLFDNMSEEETKDVLIVVCITEPWNMTFENELVSLLTKRFSKQLDQGSLDIIAPHTNFYPDLNTLKPTLGDSRHRVKWRSKQNLDYAFLMMYASQKGKYYIQLEDDLNTLKGFVTSIKLAVSRQTKDWTMLNFSHLGFIGRLFKQEDVPRILEFLLMFFSKKPCDWLLTDFLAVELCPRAGAPCKKEIDKKVKLITPTLFQHQGLRSSLEGTINKLKDKYFGTLQASKSIYTNPPTKEIICSFENYNHFTVEMVYLGKKLFWGKNPQKGDTITFLYDPPILIERIAFQTGHKKWPMDIIDHADVEVMPEATPSGNIPYKQSISEDNTSNKSVGQTILDLVAGSKKSKSSIPFYTVGTFDEKGNVDIKLERNLGKIQTLCIRFKKDYHHWVIIEQIVVLLAGH